MHTQSQVGFTVQSCGTSGSFRQTPWSHEACSNPLPYGRFSGPQAMALSIKLRVFSVLPFKNDLRSRKHLKLHPFSRMLVLPTCCVNCMSRASVPGQLDLRGSLSKRFIYFMSLQENALRLDIWAGYHHLSAVEQSRLGVLTAVDHATSIVEEQ